MLEVTIVVGTFLLGFVGGALFFRRHQFRLELELVEAKYKIAELRAKAK